MYTSFVPCRFLCVSAGNSVITTVQQLIAKGGIRELFRGLRARLYHVISIIWVQLIVYDQTKQLLGLPATGH